MIKIYNSIQEYQKTGYPSSVALGFFDGVHPGHRAVIDACLCDHDDIKSVVLTFSRPPAAVLGYPAPPLLTDNRQKARLMEKAGVDAVIFADFGEMKDDTPARFVSEVLCDALRAKKVCCGYNYRFGKGGSGDTQLLKQLCAEKGIAVDVCDPVYIDGVAVSSSEIRRLIADGEIAAANRMLGYPYAIRGAIDSGNHIGTAMGFPTLNLMPDGEVVLPRYGVYASRVTIGTATYLGATNIGVHPTVSESADPVCETFLLDYHGGDLYGAAATCELIDFIRPEQRFSSLEELTAQIQADCARIKNAMSRES